MVITAKNQATGQNRTLALPDKAILKHAASQNG